MFDYAEKLRIAETYLPQKLETKDFFNILFEMNRYFDKQFVMACSTKYKVVSAIYCE